MKGLWHLALWSHDLDASLHFYRDILGMEVVWTPDEDTFYLSSGKDNLALHRAKEDIDYRHGQTLNHLGFVLDDHEEVESWHKKLESQGVKMLNAVKKHRDASSSFYCLDPEGRVVQFLYHPDL